jgi:hypothetical protein
MLLSAVTVAVLAGGACAPTPVAAAADTLRGSYASAVTFREYLPEASATNGLWRENWERSQVDSETLERVRRLVSGAGDGDISPSWRLLAVVHPGCSDSMSSIPFLARLAEEVDGLELRLIGSEESQDLMEPYRTPDDRTATPTLLLLDQEFALAGCWVEQPRALQERWLGAARELSSRERMARKMAWYEEDAGRETLSDIASMLEEAARGGLRCP